MKIFTQNNLKGSYIRQLMILLIIFAFVFWVAELINTAIIYGTSYEDIFLYFYSDFDYPELLPFNAVLENVHINLFTSILFNIFFLPMFFRIYSEKKFVIKFSLLIFSLSLIYAFSDVLVYVGGHYFIYVKLLSYVLYKVLSIIALGIAFVLTLYKQFGRVYIGGVNFVVFLFALSSLLFLVVNLFMFYFKIGFTPEEIFYYYNGNEDLFIKGKSTESIISLLVLHMISGGIYAFVLGHFFIFVEVAYKNAIIYTAFISMLVEFLSGFFIKGGDIIFAYIKLLSFFVMEAVFAFIAIYVIKDILKGRIQWTSERSSQV